MATPHQPAKALRVRLTRTIFSTCGGLHQGRLLHVYYGQGQEDNLMPGQVWVEAPDPNDKGKHQGCVKLEPGEYECLPGEAVWYNYVQEEVIPHMPNKPNVKAAPTKGPPKTGRGTRGASTKR